MESEAGGVESAGGVADTQHVEVALQDTVLAGVTMDDDESQVEMYLLTIVLNAEIVKINGDALFPLASQERGLGGEAIPPISVHDNLIYIIFIMVELTIHLVSAGDTDVVLTAEATHNKCYILLFHDINVFSNLTPHLRFLLQQN
jgi:hypothetical protein